ncbi:ATP-binding cassette domain-containing protein [Synechococcales cyanobacterium C]|uniref:ATP-binding cassette domain-containing protein n=1 Tax=Petrachloros mirabilis ULC683 TaxID=2781853 RepID=A0A8K1ZXP8_9CYAN|nr:metal ABC transporter ATP-binding protein [Petrachloros mirabilis]NCJ05921.1 ATP-binding cassette domain-containing protein [Petrachloros mirabilis ULC683]
MLEVQELAVNYRGVLGLEAVSFAIAPGQLVGVIGPNGAGKSTLIKAMLGLIPLSHGIVRYCTCPLCQQLERVAYVPQRSQIDWDYPISVWNVVMMARTRRLGWFRSPGRATREIVRAALERVDMLRFRHRRIGELSGGQQQRVFLARALAQQAEIFLFDEPFTGVDKPTEAILFEVFGELKRQGKILLVSSHDWGDSLNQVDRLLLLNQRLIADGRPDQVMTPDNIHRAYCGTLAPAYPSDVESPFFC